MREKDDKSCCSWPLLLCLGLLALIGLITALILAFSSFSGSGAAPVLSDEEYVVV